MFGNYFKTSWRYIARNKFSSIINMGGLAIGIGVSILIGLWIWDELSFDKYHKNYDRIAQVMQHVTNNGQIQTAGVVPYPLAAELRKNYASDFASVVLATGVNEFILSQNEKTFTKKGLYAEPGFIDLFSLKILQGSSDALKDQSSILLSESAAKTFFGTRDPINQIMKINNNQDVKVAGVFEDLPQNSTFYETSFIATWDLFFAKTNWIRTAEDPWRPNAFFVYTRLADNVDVVTASAKIKDEKLKNVNAQLALKKPMLFLNPMSKWHLQSEFKNGVNTGGAIKYIWLFGIIGMFVLLLACINFMNLSTARSEKRAREVGIRKTIGSGRGQLIFQFFSESILVVAFSFVLALVFVELMLPFFNQVASKKMTIPFDNPLSWLLGLAFTFIIGMIAGSYPALYFSSFRPVSIIKGTLKSGSFSSVPRKTLVVLQFSVSVIMIIGTMIVFRQVQFVKNRPIGYNNNGLVMIPTVTNNIHKQFNTVKNELTKQNVITSIAETGNPVTESWNSSSGFEWKGKDPSLSVDFLRTDVSHDYGKTVNWEILQGRDFSRDFPTDSMGLIINEAAVKFMGLKEPVGETIKWFDESYHVIGVVKDMIVQNPYEEVKPTVYDLYETSQNYVIMRINPAMSVGTALNHIQSIFKKINPAQPFEYKFADEQYGKKFAAEERVGKLAGFFAGLAIFISCLGLFGMASFTAERRTKEIGIRKVLGASVITIWQLLSKEFVVLVIISLTIAIPLAYYFMHNWLQNYTYHTEMSWWIFAVASIVALLITLLTVSFQAIKVAIINTMKSLRTE
jgi:putative ABC transport system permease protein